MTVLRTCLSAFCFVLFILGVMPSIVAAINMSNYSDTLSDSGPSQFVNHTFRFRPTVSIGPGAYLEFLFPPEFTVLTATTTFADRNVELYINNVPRTVAPTAGAGVDAVTITRGSGGSIRYTLGTDVTIAPNSSLELRVGNLTTGTLGALTTFSSTTGTTTRPADVPPIRNSATLGAHKVAMEIVDGGVIANADFTVFINPKVTVTGDTTEEIPPFRFNGSPTGSIGGTTLNVEISLETDEFAVCRFGTVSGVDYAAQPSIFSNTGLVYHSAVVAVTPGTVANYYVRCIDDEGNFNIDDYLITFTVNNQPTGTANDSGNVSGDGTGDGNDGQGTGGGSGGTSGSADGEQPTEGTSAGSGGSGGGGGGGSGGGNGSTAGGGFESSDGPYASGDGEVTISGYAYPGARVTVLVDGQVADTATANSSGAYSVLLTEIARGAYTFGVYAVDSTGDRSGTFSTSFTVTGSRASRLSNINITPSMKVTPDPAEPGETIEISGYTLPDATVTVQISRSNGSNPLTVTALSDSNGRWRTTVDTTGFARDTYRVRAEAEQLDGRETGLSEYEYFGVGQGADRPLSPDLNRDGSVNLIDFSILLFWWQTDGGDSNPPADINQDGNVSLTDFSILLFNWTG